MVQQGALELVDYLVTLAVLEPRVLLDQQALTEPQDPMELKDRQGLQVQLAQLEDLEHLVVPERVVQQDHKVPRV